MANETVQTVTGAVSVDDLGVTLMHEHLLIGYPGWEANTLEPGPSRDEIIAVAVDKIASMQAVDNPALGEIATQVRDKLQNVISNI